MTLTGKQKEILQQGITKAYTKDELEMRLTYTIDKKLSVVAQGDRKDVVVYNLIEYLESEGLLSDFISAIIKEKPNSPFLKDVRQEFYFLISAKDNFDFVTALSHLNYVDSENKFVKVIDTQPFGIFWLNGQSHNEYKWILRRLFLVERCCHLFNLAIKRKYKFRKCDKLDDILCNLARDFKTSYTSTAIIEKIFDHWLNSRSVILVFSGIENLEPNVIHNLIEVILEPLIIKVREYQSRCSYPFFVFLSNQGEKKFNFHDNDFFIDLPLERFGENSLRNWMTFKKNILEERWANFSEEEFNKKIIVFSRDQHICNEEILEKICEQCGLDWEDIVSKFSEHFQ